MNATNMQYKMKCEYINSFKQDLEKDLGEDLGNKFASGLDEKLKDSYNFKKDCGQIYLDLARNVYGPLMCASVDWMLRSYEGSGKKGNIGFLARDAICMEEIAKTLINNGDYDISKDQIKTLYLTRKVLGINDEINPGEDMPQEKIVNKDVKYT